MSGRFFPVITLELGRVPLHLSISFIRVPFGYIAVRVPHKTNLSVFDGSTTRVENSQGYGRKGTGLT